MSELRITYRKWPNLESDSVTYNQTNRVYTVYVYEDQKNIKKLEKDILIKHNIFHIDPVYVFNPISSLYMLLKYFHNIRILESYKFEIQRNN